MYVYKFKKKVIRNTLNSSLTEVSRHFYTEPESELSQDELFKFTVPMFGLNVAFGVSTEKRRQQFQFLTKGLRPQMLRYYVGQTFAEAQV